jgi:hypothetical protein
MADNSIDFAAAFGIESVAAAVIFMILFIPVLGYSIWRVATKYNYVFVFLTLFCAGECLFSMRLTTMNSG